MKQKAHGFTIIELLIVIVAIAILAGITIVAYNGVQSRAKTTRKEADISNMKKIFEMYRVANSSYPSSTSAALALPDTSRFSSATIATSDRFSCETPGMTKEKYCLYSSAQAYALWWWSDTDKVWRYYSNSTSNSNWSYELGGGDLPDGVPG